MEKKMKLCGGTFFTLLTKIKKNRKITNPKCLQDLVDIIHVTTEKFENSTYKSNTSSYRNCEINHSEWLVFNDKDVIKEFSDKVCNPVSYPSVLADMENFIGDCLSESAENQSWLVQSVMELIDSDDSIPGDTVFYVQRDGSAVTKYNLISTTKELCFSSFLLGVWHYIIVNVYENTEGKDTLRVWYGEKEKHTVGNIDKSYFDNKFSSVVVVPYKVEAKKKDNEKIMNQVAGEKKRLTSLEEKYLASGQAMTDVHSRVINNIESKYDKRVLYSSSILTDEEESKYRNDESISLDVEEFFDPNNKKLVYRFSGNVNFKRKIDEFMNHNIVITASFGGYTVESCTTYDNWKSKSYINNILIEEDYECKIWFKIIRTIEENIVRVQILLIEEA